METKNSKFDANILVVEDYFINQELIKEMLESLSCKVDIAEDGKEALDRYINNIYDVIFMDIQIPYMDGLEVTQRIREMEKKTGLHTTIIALTANTHKESREICLQAGMDEYLTKPIQLKNLENILEKYL